MSSYSRESGDAALKVPCCDVCEGPLNSPFVEASGLAKPSLL